MVDGLALRALTRPDVQGHHLTGRPVTVLPMTRRWISDVPSKMVKICEGVLSFLITDVYAGKSVYAHPETGQRRTGTAVAGPGVHPVCSPGSTR